MLAVYQKGNYSLQDERGNEKGRLIKEGVFSSKTRIETREGQVEFLKEGIFSPVRIHRNGLEIGEVQSRWDSLVFKVDLESRIRQFRVCQKNFWKSSFKLINEYKEELLVIVPQFKWSKMNYDYKIEIIANKPFATSPMVLLLAVYGVRKLLERQYAAS